MLSSLYILNPFSLLLFVIYILCTPEDKDAQLHSNQQQSRGRLGHGGSGASVQEEILNHTATLYESKIEIEPNLDSKIRTECQHFWDQVLSAKQKYELKLEQEFKGYTAIIANIKTTLSKDVKVMNEQLSNSN